MNISPNTIAILRNFSAINSSIYIREGNVLRTISVSGNIAAKAKIGDEFETSFALYDLNQFLNGLKIYDQPSLDFSKNNCVIIKEGRHKITYRLTDPSLIFYPEDRDIKLPSTDVSFELTTEQYEKLVKSSNIFSLPDLSIVGENGEINVKVRDKENSSSNEVAVLVGETNDDFSLNFKIENVKIIPGNYTVNVSKELIAEFRNQNHDLTYWIGLDSDSSFEF